MIGIYLCSDCLIRRLTRVTADYIYYDVPVGDTWLTGFREDRSRLVLFTLGQPVESVAKGLSILRTITNILKSSQKAAINPGLGDHMEVV